MEAGKRRMNLSVSNVSLAGFPAMAPAPNPTPAPASSPLLPFLLLPAQPALRLPPAPSASEASHSFRGFAKSASCLPLSFCIPFHCHRRGNQGPEMLGEVNS